MTKLAHYLTPAQAAALLAQQAAELRLTEFAQIRNLDFVLPPFELLPLGPRSQPPLPRIAAFAVDMDGTSTTTEPLALHALEYMVRRFTGRLTKAQWAGLDQELDYPHVIGNSNFRHTEFLVNRYHEALDWPAFRGAFVEAVTWTLACMTDVHRRRDVQQNARNCGLAALLDDPEFKRFTADESRARAAFAAPTPDRTLRALVDQHAPAFRAEHLSEQVAAALDIYYMRYHSILRELERGEGARLAAELLGDGGRRLVEPMPGYEVFLPLIKGWLGPEVEALYEPLRAYLLQRGHAAAELDGYRGRLAQLAARMRQTPAKVALVTASIAYETHACMKEVIAVTRERVQSWPVSSAVRERLAENLADYRAVFDGFVCATDAWEGRLKPHRDLYSIALFQMSIPKRDYPYVVGLEDTEPGCIALRGAGIGCAVALPNHDTRQQDYSAAVEVVRGGLPELMLVRNLLLA
jgi:beta-phosphoglucomutase-like phosphatase (HAD superfamily)